MTIELFNANREMLETSQTLATLRLGVILAMRNFLSKIDNDPSFSVDVTDRELTHVQSMIGDMDDKKRQIKRLREMAEQQRRNPGVSQVDMPDEWYLQDAAT